MNTLFFRPFFSTTAALLCLLVEGSQLLAESPVTLSPEAGERSKQIDYAREIQPLLAEHCLHCHGVDASAREGGLRLDTLEGVLAGGDSGEPAVVPGDAKSGTLLARVLSDVEDERMPPVDQNNPLSAEQIALLQRWIGEGANYAKHWAFTPPVKPAIATSDGEHPIDVLVAKRLLEKGLTSSPMEEADRLCRRVYLDLVGLPPSIEELEAFRRDGLNATVERLLGSDRFGEKWARVWLDAARYSDTNGYEKDLPREQWIWRDWVIRAFNQDMPYNQFVIEQIAGDLLPNATQDQLIATGFLRNSMLNEEGAIVPEQFRMVEMFDRLDCVGKAVLGLTTQCAQCHTHKFDPLTHDEYFGMFAYLNNAYEAQSWIYNDEQEKKKQEVLEGVSNLDAEVQQAASNWQEAMATYVRSLVEGRPLWSPVQFHQLESISGLNHPVQLQDDSILMLGHTSGDVFFVGAADLAGVTGLQLELLPHKDLPFGGPGRNRVGGWNIHEMEVLVRRPGTETWEKQTLLNATSDFSEPDQKHDEGKRATGPVAYLIDGNDQNVWKADRGTALRNQASVAVVQFEKPLEFPAGSEVKVVLRMGDMVGCCRISLTKSTSPAAPAVDHSAVLAACDWKESQAPLDSAQQEGFQRLFHAWVKSDSSLQAYRERYDSLWKAFPAAMTSVLHLAERPENDRRITYFLDRGEWDKPTHAVDAHVPEAFHSLPEQASNNRLGFARWLVAPESPLAARVAVNRVWQAIFGEGLVETSEDFGTRSPVPEHLEVLDWLAVDFMQNGWSHKDLIRKIVTSKTYQQSSRVTDLHLQSDPRNRWLTRGPRFRADAEVIRDVVLACAGILHHRMGGPGVIPPVPQNVLDYNYTYPSYWTPATGPERYRRSVYGFRKRSMPDPVMSNFDAPNSDAACVRRVRSNTPLAALTSLNEPIFVEAARAFALRVLREGGEEDLDRIRYAYRVCTSREPSEQESIVTLDLLKTHRQRIADGWLSPREIATGDPAKLPEIPSGATPQDVAAWTLTGRVLLNLDETLSKN